MLLATTAKHSKIFEYTDPVDLAVSNLLTTLLVLTLTWTATLIFWLLACLLHHWHLIAYVWRWVKVWPSLIYYILCRCWICSSTLTRSFSCLHTYVCVCAHARVCVRTYVRTCRIDVLCVSITHYSLRLAVTNQPTLASALSDTSHTHTHWGCVSLLKSHQ